MEHEVTVGLVEQLCDGDLNARMSNFATRSGRTWWPSTITVEDVDLAAEEPDALVDFPLIRPLSTFDDVLKQTFAMASAMTLRQTRPAKHRHWTCKKCGGDFHPHMSATLCDGCIRKRDGMR